LTIIIDDAGAGDLLLGVVIGAYRLETGEYHYDIIDVKYFQPPRFRKKEYLEQASKITLRLLDKLKPTSEEPVQICQGYIFDKAVRDLREKYDEDHVSRTRVEGEAQRYTETAYLDEIRNLGYTSITSREQKRAKSFFHMMNWLQRNPDKVKYAKTGWPRLARYRFFKALCRKPRLYRT
jgi:hypothetical protein